MPSSMASSGIEAELFFLHMTGYLESNTLASFEVVCHSAHKSILDGRVWIDHFQHALPCFEIGDRLNESIALATNRDDRRKVKAALGKLIKLDLLMTAPMPLSSLTVAHRLGCALLNADSVADMHLNSGGGLAVSSALCFRFRDLEKVAKAPKMLGHWEAHKGGSTKPEDWVVSEPEKIQVPITTLVENNVGTIEVLSSCFDIQVRIAYLNTKIMISALAHVPHNFADSEFAVDFACLEPDFLLHSRNMELSLNGKWKEVKGLRSTSPSPGQLSKTMASGLMCVVSFRDIVSPSDAHGLKHTAGISALSLESLAMGSRSR